MSRLHLIKTDDSYVLMDTQSGAVLSTEDKEGNLHSDKTGQFVEQGVADKKEGDKMPVSPKTQEKKMDKDYRNDKRYSDKERTRLKMSWSNYDAFCQKRAKQEAKHEAKVEAIAKQHSLAGDEYNHDAHGNLVVSKRIPGSAPDDRI